MSLLLAILHALSELISDALIMDDYIILLSCYKVLMWTDNYIHQPPELVVRGLQSDLLSSL